MVNNKKKSNHLFLLFVIILMNLFICYTAFHLYKDNFTFRVTNYNVTYNDLKAIIKSDNGIRNSRGVLSMKSQDIIDSLKGKTIVQISDFHNEQFGQNNKDFIQALESINPDVVLITGDIVSRNNTDYNGAFSLLEGIGSKYDCYYITGNHEKAVSDELRESILNKLEECYIKYIDDKVIEIFPHVRFYGLSYGISYYNSKYTVSKMKKVFGEADDEYFNILVTHDPAAFDTYSEWGADLIFAGHTHGGMIRLFDRGLISPDRTFWPKYDGGIYNDNDGNSDYNTMIISKGLSRGQNGFRLFNTPELVVIKF